jgi:uncharacterized protein (DUF2141 family)
MKRNLPVGALLAALITAGISPGAALAADGTLRITATNVKSDDGSVIVWIYDKADTWLSDNFRTQKSVKVAGNRQGGAVTVELLLPPGQYAFTVFQDVDANGQLARNFIGIPKEPSGLSNNLRPRFGPPKFKDALVTVGTAALEQRIKLQ